MSRNSTDDIRLITEEVLGTNGRTMDWEEAFFKVKAMHLPVNVRLVP